MLVKATWAIGGSPTGEPGPARGRESPFGARPAIWERQSRQAGRRPKASNPSNRTRVGPAASRQAVFSLDRVPQGGM